MSVHANIAFFIPHLGCPHCCSFCNQRTISGQQAAVSPESVRSQLKTAFERDLDPEKTEIAFFGGSFTCIPSEQMTAYLEAAAPYVQAGKCRGIRISTRPDGITPEILALLAQYGVSAIELGAQSMDENVLLRNLRGHTADDVRQASALIRNFPGRPFLLGLQIMTGLWGEDVQSRSLTEQAVLDIHPDTLRIYPTVVLRGTILGEKFLSGEYCPPDTAQTIAFLAPMLHRFEQAGIRVIRLGLHASPDLEENMLAGAYHPAFRELCEAELFRQEMERQLLALPKGQVLVKVHPRSLSKAAGQKKSNLLWAEARGYPMRLVPDERMDLREILIQKI